jgi:two-component system LytT family response regulator
LRALIVDDEPLARRGISLRLAEFDVEIVGECFDGVSAVESILELAPDVVFLDIQMPGMDGFDVLRNIPKEHIPEVIFITAYEQHAVRAFEVHALDYLLKPIDDDRFAEAVRRAATSLDANSRIRTAERIIDMLETQKQQYLSRLIVRTGSRLHVVLAEETEWIGSADDYAELHTKGRTHLLRETLSELERRLDPAKFMRIHRSRIVRIDCITELKSIDNREYLVKLSDGSQHRSSRTYADRLTAWLKPNPEPSRPSPR